MTVDEGVTSSHPPRDPPRPHLLGLTAAEGRRDRNDALKAEWTSRSSKIAGGLKVRIL